MNSSCTQWGRKCGVAAGAVCGDEMTEGSFDPELEFQSDRDRDAYRVKWLGI
jgi:hypothetical protein